MTSTSAAQRSINRDTELAYWRSIHAIGRLGQHEFDHYRRLLEMGYDVYQAYPRANEEQLYKVLQDSYHAHYPALAVSWDEARWLVRHAWHHAEQEQAAH